MATTFTTRIKHFGMFTTQNTYFMRVYVMCLVMYINSTNIPPIMIMNRMNENQNLLHLVPLMRHTVVVCINSIGPVAIGCFICVNINLVIVLIDISNFVMSGVFYLKC